MSHAIVNSEKNWKIFQIKAKLSFRSGSTYREVISLPEFDLCILAKSSHEDFLMKQMVDLVGRLITNVKGMCPRISINATDVSFPSHKIFSVLPSGLYKTFIKVKFAEKSPTMFNVTAVFQLDSYRDRIGNWMRIVVI